MADAEYALAVLDPGAIRSAANARESTLTDYVVTLTVEGAPAAAAPRLDALRAAASAAHPVSDVVETTRTGYALGPPTARDRPWIVEERFQFLDPNRDGPVEDARVLRIYDGAFVVAWIERGDSTRLAQWLSRFDSAYAVAREYAFPLLRSAFVDAVPKTSTRSGQYLILLRDSLVRDGVGSYVGFSHSETAGDTAFTWIELKVDTAYQTTGLASLLTHEMTHSYQRMYMHATRAGGANSITGAALWGVEGGANLLSYETMRRYAGLPLDGNYDWRAPGASAAARHVARRAQPGTGQFTRGYDDAMGFLRHLVVRRARAGATTEAAIREVARGAVEGWYGYDGITRRAGLAARMRALLGSRWDPAEALLDWTLSHAADDLTDNPDFQDRTSLRVWDIPAGTAGWRASSTLTSAQADSAQVVWRYGSPFFAHLRDGGNGIILEMATYRLNPNPMPGPGPLPLDGLHWKLVRIR